MEVKILFSTLLLLCFCPYINKASGQVADTAEWTLQRCINYALQENISVRKSYNTNDINTSNYSQAKANRLPTLSATATQGISWNEPISSITGNYGNFATFNNSSYAVNSSTSLFNGFKVSNNIKQAELSLEAGKFDSETMKESISLTILNAYLQVIFAEEQVSNSQKQVELTKQQLNLAEERFHLGVISKSDYLQVKSQLASEKYTLATAENTLAINKVTLMQLMELPVNNSFNIFHPDFGNFQYQAQRPNADSIYITALGIKPQVKSAALNRQYANLGVKISKADYLPKLLFNAGINSAYTNYENTTSYGYQVQNKLNPTLGLTLSIPIYQNRQVKTKVEIAKINTSNAELDEKNVKNQLRKSIEQACVDAVSAETQYEASAEQYDAALESYKVASEKFKQGAINSVDFLIQKTNLITAESKLLQAKYNLIFSRKTIDFYTGTSLSL